MRKWHRAALAVAAITVLTLSAAAASPAAGSAEHGYTFAVIGDIPYGDAQIANFPNVIAQINADPSVEWVDHLGDIKDGSSVCSDEYFQMIKSDFDQFSDPLVYTVGDNEWTDCHRTEQRRLQPARAPGQGAAGVLPTARPHARSAQRFGCIAGRSGDPGERAVAACRRSLRRSGRRRQQRQPRAMDRATPLQLRSRPPRCWLVPQR